MKPADAFRLARSLLPAEGGLRAELDDEGNLLLYVRKDLLHLDADALHDRLHHWTLNEVHRVLPRAAAILSFRHALPEDPASEATLDLQEGWRGLEATLLLETTPEPTEQDVRTLAALVPRFLAVVEASGRPQGFRHYEVGTTE